MEQPSRVCCSRGDRKGLSFSKVFVWSEIESKCMVW